MSITLYGIKNCSTMKKAFDKLTALGLEYGKHPTIPSTANLKNAR
jgi:arsenate reductase-like glutaredoxin family protein